MDFFEEKTEIKEIPGSRYDQSLRRRLLARQPLSREQLCSVGPQSYLYRAALEELIDSEEVLAYYQRPLRGRPKKFYALKGYTLPEGSELYSDVTPETLEDYRTAMKERILTSIASRNSPTPLSSLWKCMRPPLYFLGELLQEMETDNQIKSSTEGHAKYYQLI